MNKKIVSQLNEAGVFVGGVVADESPMEPGVWLIPGGAVDQAAPEDVRAGMQYRPDGAGGWIEEPAPVQEPVPGVEQPSAEAVRRAEIIGRLGEIDRDTARPARVVALAVANGQDIPAFERNKLAVLEEEAETLRMELAAL